MPGEDTSKPIKDADAPTPIKSPLNETDAREFIKREVERALVLWGKRLAAVIGITTVIGGLIPMCRNPGGY